MSDRTPLLSEDEAWAFIEELLRLSAWLVHRIERGKGFAMTELEAAAVSTRQETPISMKHRNE